MKNETGHQLGTKSLRALIGVLALCAPIGTVWGHGDTSGFSDEPERIQEAVHASSDSAMLDVIDYFPAEVLIDPRRLISVPIKINARVASLKNLYPGKFIRRDSVLGELESAELETVQRTYAALVANMDAVQEASVTGAERAMTARIDLEWRGMSPDDIQQLESSGQPVRRITVRAPVSGYLYAVNVVENQLINATSNSQRPNAAGPTFATIAPANAVVVEASVPPAYAAKTKPGDRLRMRTTAGTAITSELEGIVQGVFSYVNPVSQRQRVRIAIKDLHHADLPMSGLTILVGFPRQ